MEGLTLRCPVLPNWNMKQNRTCKRYFFCSDERHGVCKAKPPEHQLVTPYSKSKGCPCKYTAFIPTDEYITIRGQQKRVYEVVCKECGRRRRTVI